LRRLVWSSHARQDFREIITYIAAKNPSAAAGVRDRFNETASRLAEMPTGRRGRVAGTYEKVLPGLPYIIAYVLETTPAGGDVLTILRVIHGARDWRPREWPSH
jgi:toxin ParE1/3/4